MLSGLLDRHEPRFANDTVWVACTDLAVPRLNVEHPDGHQVPLTGTAVLDESGWTPVVDLPDVGDPGGKVDRQACLLENFAHETLGDELVVLDDSAGKTPEQLFARSTLEDEHNLAATTDDRRRDLMRGTRAQQDQLRRDSADARA